MNIFKPYLLSILVVVSTIFYNVVLILDTFNPTHTKQTDNLYINQKNIYDKIVEGFPLKYSSMFKKGGRQRSTMIEYNKFFELNPEYSKYKMTSDDNNSLDKIMFSKLITDTLCSKYIAERNKEILTMNDDELASWLIEKNTMILLRYSSNKPSSLDVWTMSLKDIETIRPEAVYVLKQNFYKSKE